VADGGFSQVGWRALGCNIDGLASNEHSTNVCVPVAGANPKAVKTDGNGGADNSFGENLLPIFVGLASDFSTRVNEAFAQGMPTTLLVLRQVGSGPTYFPVEARAYGGAQLGHVPTWDGTDAWPVTYESVADGQLDAPLLSWSDSYVVDRTWVSGTLTSAVLPVVITLYSKSPYVLRLAVHRAVLLLPRIVARRANFQAAFWNSSLMLASRVA
jgi:hypothetical protein